MQSAGNIRSAGANFDASRVRQFEIKHLPCGTRATETSGNSQLTVAQACDRQTDRQTRTQRQTAVLHKDGLVAFSDIHPGTTWYSIGRQKEPRVLYTALFTRMYTGREHNAVSELVRCRELDLLQFLKSKIILRATLRTIYRTSGSLHNTVSYASFSTEDQ